MKSLFFMASSLVVLTAIVAEQQADALMIAPVKPGPNRVALNEAIVIGRVVGMEDVDVKVPAAPGSQAMMTYRIAIVRVTEIVKGNKEMKQLRVGFVPTTNIGGNPGAAPNIAIGGRPGFANNVQLQAGMDGLFFLSKHPTADFLTVANQFDFIASQNKALLDNELAEAKHATQLLADPMANLQSKNAKDRYLTAALLITLYRNQTAPGLKTELVSVEESKLILSALASADWTPAKIGAGTGGIPRQAFDPMAPMNMFGMLGVTMKDGFQPPTKIKSAEDYPNAAKQWCRDNAGKYQILRFVAK